MDTVSVGYQNRGEIKRRKPKKIVMDETLKKDEESLEEEGSNVDSSSLDSQEEEMYLSHLHGTPQEVTFLLLAKGPLPTGISESP